MFDPTGKGSISGDQYQQALLSLGIEKPAVELYMVICWKEQASLYVLLASLSLYIFFIQASPYDSI